MSVRIGLWGAIANAGYTLARVLRKAGYDAEFIRDPADRYPMSQPLWEEVELSIPATRLPHDPPQPDEWARLAEAAGYRDPDWVIIAPPARVRELGTASLLRSALLGVLARRYRTEFRSYLAAHAGLVRQMGRYDWLVVCGVGVVDAFLSGRPYVYWPNGGELRLLPFRDETAYDRFFAIAMRAAITRARVAGTHDPTLADCFAAVGVERVAHLPFLIDTDRWSPSRERHPYEHIRELAGERTILFHAARQDFQWKGSDRFIRAFVRAVREGANLFLVVSPWGNDLDAVRGIVADGGAADAVTFLEEVPSKPLLARLYTLADVVVDQFALGVHGSTMLEAMACATPVLIALDTARFRERWPGYVPPPVINVRTEDEIHSTLHAVARLELDLGRLGSEARAWVAAHHGPSQADRFVPENAR